MAGFETPPRTITYDTAYGVCPDSLCITDDVNTVFTANELPQLTADGYIFLGWYDIDDNKVEIGDSLPTIDMTLYAKWEVDEASSNTTVKDKMTALADEIRILSGTTDAMGLDAMKNNVADANDAIDEQEDLIAQIASALEGKAAGGGNSENIEICTVTINSSNYSGTDKAIYFTWETVENGQITVKQLYMTMGYYVLETLFPTITCVKDGFIFICHNPLSTNVDAQSSFLSKSLLLDENIEIVDANIKANTYQTVLRVLGDSVLTFK